MELPWQIFSHLFIFSNTGALRRHSDRSAGYSPTSHNRYFVSIPVRLYGICGEQSGTESVFCENFCFPVQYHSTSTPYSFVYHRPYIIWATDGVVKQQIKNEKRKPCCACNCAESPPVVLTSCGFSKVLAGLNGQTSEPHSVIKLFVVVVVNLIFCTNLHFCVAKSLISCLSVCWTVEHSVTAAEGMLEPAYSICCYPKNAPFGGITCRIVCV